MKRNPNHAQRSDSEREQDVVIARAKQGDSEAIHYLYVKHVNQVHNFVRSIVQDSHDAEDITQSVFAKVIASVHRYERRDVRFSAWVLRIARNTALDHLRAQHSVPSEDVEHLSDTHDDAATGIDRARNIRTAIEGLPGEQREVVVLRHIAGLSPREIATRLNKTEGSVHSLHHRGRGAVRAALAELDAVPVVGR